MAQKNIKLTTTASSISKSMNTQSSSKPIESQTQPQKIIVESYIIIWLDANLDFSNEKNQEFISQLRSIVNMVKTSTDINQCVEFLGQIKNEKIFLIISDSFAKQIASLEEQFDQLHSIYIFSDRDSKSNENIKKGKGVFTQIKLLCNELKNEVRQLNHDFMSTSIIPASSTDLNELEPSFMYFQLLKENLFTIEYNHETEISQLADYCRPHFKKDEVETRRIVDFEQTYDQKSPIWWYTLECFLYRMLNYALRTLEIETLIKMGFFIRDLHRQIEQCHSQLTPDQIPPIVYRGQGLSNNDFEKLKNAKNGLFSFNNFLSTTIDESVAVRFARSSQQYEKTTSILFEIKIDPSVSSIPFASIAGLSAVSGEEEILFSVSTVFRIGEITKLDNRLWKVNLTLTNARDPLLKRLTEHMRNSLGAGNGWRQMGQLMIKMGQFDKAEEIYKILLKIVDNDDKAECAFLNNQLGYVLKQKGDLKEAFSHYNESLEINRKLMSETDARLSSTYSNIGGILKKLGDSDGALKYYELVLKIDTAAPKPNQLEIAIDHNNIGSVLDDQGKYSGALKSYEQALNIKRTHLPPHHPSLASTYSNIGSIHRKIGDYSTALSYYQQTLEIQTKSLPPNHPSFIVTYGKLATVLEDLHRYEDAIKHAQQAVDIARKVFKSPHPEVEARQKYLDELRKKL